MVNSTNMVNMRSRRAWVLACLLALLPAGLTAKAQPSAIMLYVVPDGERRTVGTGGKETDPTSATSLDQALAIAAAKRRLFPDAHITIQLAAGTYRRANPIVIDSTLASDGSFELQAIPGAEVTLLGSISLGSPLAEAPQRLLNRLPPQARTRALFYDVQKAKIGDYPVQQPRGNALPRTEAEVEFFAGGRPLWPARWPNQSYAVIDKIAGPGASDVDAATLLSVAGVPFFALSSGQDGWASGYFGASWRYERVRITALDPIKEYVRVDRPTGWYPIEKGAPVAFENAPLLLDSPGEFFYDSNTGILAAWPESGTPESIEASVAEHLLDIRGAKNVRIAGLRFLNTRGDGLTVRDSESVNIIDCFIANTGERGIAVMGGRNVHISRTVVRDSGDEGVWLEGGDRKTLTSAGHRVDESIIAAFGRRVRAGRAGIWIDGVGNSAEHNIIADGPFTAIWFQGNDHALRRNEILRVVRECGDCGAIYTGQDWTARGTLIEENFVHDLGGERSLEAKAIYLDDLASGITVRRNIIVGAREAVLIGGGRDNVVDGNVIAGATKYGLFVDHRGTEWFAPEIADANSVIRKRLSAISVESEPYKSRYGHLKDILSDQPGLPKYNIVKRNVYLRGRGTFVEAGLENRTDLELGPIDTGQTAFHGDTLSTDSLLESEDFKDAIRRLGIPIPQLQTKDRLAKALP